METCWAGSSQIKSVDGEMHDFNFFGTYGCTENLFEVAKFNAVLISWECIKSLFELIFFSIHYLLNLTVGDDDRLYYQMQMFTM